ncbi:MAG: heparan-alpha-glucosaminide N-acetyltransferase [Methanolinea sp.]|nr:heparan-alpha-glucosaminide N-acetyltransferase [Methanolinea sp.]
MRTRTSRYWEIDFARGIAVTMMVTYHVVFDFAYLGVTDARASLGQWRPLALATATLFLLLVGISLTISSARVEGKLAGRAYALKFARRGAGLFLAGLSLTAITLVVVPASPILFGILHLIGVSVMLAPFFLRYSRANLVAGLSLVAAGPFVGSLEGPLPLLWIGLHPAGFSSLDYTPLVPWLGVVLVGVFAGKVLYPGGERRVRVRGDVPPLGGGICLLGRHSLAIYFLHQPVILLGIALFFGIPRPA